MKQNASRPRAVKKTAAKNLQGPTLAVDTTQTGPEADRLLIDRCLASEADAWEELYDDSHPGLLVCIRIAVQRMGLQADLVDEIAARVWHSLVAGGGRLLNTFDPSRGCRFTTYFAVFANKEILLYLRSERRQRARDMYVGKLNLRQEGSSPWGIAAEVNDFLLRLTPKERPFCETQMLAPSEAAELELSASNVWQLRHRVRRKLENFLGCGDKQ